MVDLSDREFKIIMINKLKLEKGDIMYEQIGNFNREVDI